MLSFLRILLAVLSGLAGIGAIYLIQSPGRYPYEQALELAAVTFLIAATLLNTVWDKLSEANAPEPAAASASAGQPAATRDAAGLAAPATPGRSATRPNCSTASSNFQRRRT